MLYNEAGFSNHWVKVMRITSERLHNKAIERVIKPLRELIKIDYFTYCRYSTESRLPRTEKCDMITSNSVELNEFINSPHTCFPADVTMTSAVLDWQTFCTESWLKYSSERYNISECSAVTFVLRHNDREAEHISLNTNDSDISLINTMHSQPKLMHNIISHIRNQINFNKESFKSLAYRKRISQRDEQNTTDENNIIKPHNREFIIGMNGPTYLTRVEKKCYQLLLEMKTSKEIAEGLKTSTRTVECHVANLRKKLGVTKRHHFFQVACNNFIVSKQ